MAIEESDALTDLITIVENVESSQNAPSNEAPDADGNFMGTDIGKTEMIKEWFQQQFTKLQDESL